MWTYDLLCEYFWGNFINFTLDNKSFTDSIGLLSSLNFKQIDKKYLSIFNKCNILYIIMKHSHKFINFYPNIVTNINKPDSSQQFKINWLTEIYDYWGTNLEN